MNPALAYMIQRFDLLLIPFTPEQEAKLELRKWYGIQTAYNRLKELGQLPDWCDVDHFRTCLEEYERDGLGYMVEGERFCRVEKRPYKPVQSLTVQDLCTPKEERHRLVPKPKRNPNQKTI